MSGPRLLRVRVELIPCLETLSLDALVGLDGETGLAHLPEDIINLANFVLVLKIYASHQEGHVAVQHVADKHPFTSVREFGYGLHVLGGTLLKT